MAKSLALELSPNQVTALMAALPENARLPGSGIAYADRVLTVPSEFSAAATAAMKKPGWDAPPDPKVALLAYAAEKRWQVENAGTTFEGRPLRTDRETRSALTEAHVAASLDATFATPWQLRDGTTLVVSSKNLPAIIAAVARHRASAFVRFDAVKARIESGEIGTDAEVDAAFGSD